MSADGWRVCPRCFGDGGAAKAERDELEAWIDTAYGVAHPDEYMAAVKRLREMPAYDHVEPFELEGDNSTFREDYEFYIKDMVFHATYSGWCQVCKYGWDYHETMAVPTP